MLRDLFSLPLEEQLALRSTRDRLRREFAEQLDEETIDTVLRAGWEHVESLARVKVHVPLLAERFARAQLWALARMRGHRDEQPAVLFIDTHDAGRARMAKALFAARARSRGVAISAGTDPNAALDAEVRAVMEEVGILTTESFPKPYTQVMLEAADIVVTFADGGDVAVPDESKHLVWDVPSPQQRSLEELRAIRDRLGVLVDELLARLGIPQPA